MSMRPAWGPKLFLVLVTTTIVIGNYQRHRERIYLRGQLVNGHKVTKNITRLQEEIIANLPPLRIPRLRHHRVTDWDPYFENAEGQGINGSQNVALHLGATALLDCRVAMLSGKKVMWLRRNADWASLLTLGNTTHISDPRYSVSFQYPNNWRLAIAGVRREDRGLYVCQVNTHPPRMLVTNVTVLVCGSRCTQNTDAFSGSDAETTLNFVPGKIQLCRWNLAEAHREEDCRGNRSTYRVTYFPSFYISSYFHL